jgi:hypothetical protein
MYQPSSEYGFKIHAEATQNPTKVGVAFKMVEKWPPLQRRCINIKFGEDLNSLYETNQL